jgi:hypothetical protein
MLQLELEATLALAAMLICGVLVASVSAGVTFIVRIFLADDLILFHFFTF